MVVHIYHTYCFNPTMRAELCDSGSLYDYVRELENPLDNELRQQWAMEIAKGMIIS